MNLDSYNQSLENECYSNGTFCYSCGELDESLITDGSSFLKQPSGKPYLCDKCNEVILEDIRNTKKIADTEYEVLFNADDITFKSLLEQGFTFIDQQEDELYV